MTNHADLSAERWNLFTLDQQILMIANEMNRAAKLMGVLDQERRQACYERALQLVDLTLGLEHGLSLKRELRIWRGVIADLHARKASEPATHRTAFKLLLQLTPVASLQVAYLDP
jgi:hypothetical protein